MSLVLAELLPVELQFRQQVQGSQQHVTGLIETGSSRGGVLRLAGRLRLFLLVDDLEQAVVSHCLQSADYILLWQPPESHNAAH